MDDNEKIERSLITAYRKRIWSPFVKAIKNYELIKDGDKIAVCISGGKDSMLLAKCFQELLKHGKQNFSVEFLCMNPGYNPVNKQRIIDNAQLMEIPIRMFDSDIFEVVTSIEENPCYLCARMRRGWLYSKAKELGCNKIALGHHLDDVIETTLMGILYNGQIQGMMPKLKSANFEGMELIRPLYMVKERDIINWREYNNLKFIQCACRFTEAVGASKDGVGESKRQEMKELIKSLVEKNPHADDNIFNCINNINMDTVLGYKKGKEYHSFLENYDNE